ncbi:hypothetical protein TWF506_006889 [Arthrobotrys conoides]|uniref:Ankyrin n=1 Tax=Arthrobotrys conoides TaxID=74498 RepID=A0AAN8NMS1_9PEZI
MAPTSASSGPAKPTINPPPPTLDEDTIDDLLYFSRTGELSDLKETISELSKSLNRYSLEIPASAVDPYSGNTCLHMAAANNHVEVVEYILSLEPPPLATPVVHPEVSSSSSSTNNTTTSTSLSNITSDGTTITVLSSYLHTLLNFPNESGNTPLHWACLNGHIEAVKVLVKAGADPGVLNAAGHDCVYEAEVNDKSNVVEWVLNFAEGLESGVGVVGDEDGDEKDQEQKESKDNADVLRDEGSHHQEKDDEGKEKDGQAGVAIEKLDISDKEPTIR